MKKKLTLWLAVALCAVTLTGCFRFERKVDTPAATDAAYIEKLNEIVALLDEKYVDGYDTSKLGDCLAQAAVSATGDRWSYYVSAEDYEKLLEQNNNAYVGIGVTIQKVNEADEGYTVVSVTHNGPAEAASILTGDMIVAVEGQSTTELTMTDTQQLVRGEEGTQVNLTLLRDGERLDVAVTRKTIEVDVVKYEMLDDNIGYLKINNFENHCYRDSVAAIEDLLSQGATSLIFDLRFNPGGRKNELVQLLDYLLPEGPLFRSVDYQGKETIDYSDEKCLSLPMAVIVNDDSYSAAEFFAAALQEYHAGVVVGTQTCGKANYQQTYRLSDGSAVAVSTGHYQTPNGVTLAGVGVTPDQIVEVDDETYAALYYEKVAHADDAQLQAAISALKQ